MIPFELSLYGLSQRDHYLKQGKAPLDAFSDAAIDATGQFGAIIAEELIKALFQGIKLLFKDKFRMW
jgi:hypothetical protein